MDADIGKDNRIIKGQLLTFKEDMGYITYVFKNLNDTTPFDRYVMCTRFPNWDCEHLKVGDIGFVLYKFVEAGKSQWYNIETKEFEAYKYTNCIFLNFIREKTQNEDIIL